jgi:PAS domain-containing protein
MGDESNLQHLEQSPVTVGIQVIGFDWHYLYVNDSFMQQVNLPDPSLLCGKHIEEVFPGISETVFYQKGTRCLELREAQSLAGSLPLGDFGHWAEHFFNPHPDGMIVVGLMLPRLGVPGESLTRLVDYLDYTAMASSDMLYDWDLHQNKIWWNEAYYRRLGFELSSAYVDFDIWAEGIHLADKGPILEDMNRAMQQEEGYWSGRYRYKKSDGTYVQLLDRGYISYSKDGKPMKFIGCATDISKLNYGVEALQRVLYSISHHVRHPVTQLQGLIMMLDRKELSQAEMKVVAGFMQHSIKDLDRFTRELNDRYSSL